MGAGSSRRCVTQIDLCRRTASPQRYGLWATAGYGSTEMSWHGFRALASTQLHELGWNDRWIETQLVHADRNKIGSAYNHAKYLPQRRTMMQAWSDYLDTLRVQTDITISHHSGEQAALTAMEAFQHADSQRALSFQTQAMGGVTCHRVAR